jgi:hypothetical protein
MRSPATSRVSRERLLLMLKVMFSEASRSMLLHSLTHPRRLLNKHVRLETSLLESTWPMLARILTRTATVFPLESQLVSARLSSLFVSSLHIHSFNFPAMIPLWMFPLAIATGNTMLLKPSERDPGAAMLLTKLAQDAGFPNGVLNIVHGAVDSLFDFYLLVLRSQPSISSATTPMSRPSRSLARTVLADTSTTAVLPTASVFRQVSHVLFCFDCSVEHGCQEPRCDHA